MPIWVLCALGYKYELLILETYAIFTLILLYLSVDKWKVTLVNLMDIKMGRRDAIQGPLCQNLVCIPKSSPISLCYHKFELLLVESFNKWAKQWCCWSRFFLVEGRRQLQKNKKERGNRRRRVTVFFVGEHEVFKVNFCVHIPLYLILIAMLQAGRGKKGFLPHSLDSVLWMMHRSEVKLIKQFSVFKQEKGTPGPFYCF